MVIIKGRYPSKSSHKIRGIDKVLVLVSVPPVAQHKNSVRRLKLSQVTGQPCSRRDAVLHLSAECQIPRIRD